MMLNTVIPIGGLPRGSDDWQFQIRWRSPPYTLTDSAGDPDRVTGNVSIDKYIDT